MLSVVLTRERKREERGRRSWGDGRMDTVSDIRKLPKQYSHLTSAYNSPRPLRLSTLKQSPQQAPVHDIFPEPNLYILDF